MHCRSSRAFIAMSFVCLLPALLPTAVCVGQATATRPDTRPARVLQRDGLTARIPAEVGRLDDFHAVEGQADTFRCTIRTWERKLTGGGPQFHFSLERAASRRTALAFRYWMGDGKPWWGRVRYYMLRLGDGAYERHAMPRDQVVPLAVGPQPVTICRSVPFPLSAFAARLKAWSAKAGVQVTVIGRSVRQRPIHRLVFGGTARQRPPTLWLLSRQHPAEASGQYVAAAVLDALLGDDPPMRSLRQRVRFSCVPLMNPDAVAERLWRFNAGGVDLNRDWVAARQPETRAVRAALEADLGAGLAPAAMIDFHSTYSTYWYVPAKGVLGGAAAGFIPALIERANRHMGPDFTAPQKPAFSRRIGSTSGSYFVGRFGIPAATAEMAYHALPAESETYGRAIARALGEVPIPLPSPASRPASVPAERE